MEQIENKSKMEQKSSLIWKVTWVVLVLQTVATAILLKFLPEQIPMHFGSQGNADRYGYKSELIFLIALTAFVILMCRAYSKSCREDFAKAEDERKRNTSATMLYVSAIFSLVLALTMAGVSIGLAVNSLIATDSADGTGFVEIFVMIMNAVIGLIMILLGNVMPKTSANGVFGVRTSWSSYNDETWSRTNRIGGKVCVATGIVSIIIALFVNYRYSSVIIVALIIVMAVALVIVSYKVYQNVINKTTDAK